MGRNTPTKDELFAFLLLQELHLLEETPVSVIKWDKPDIQIGETIGIEVVQQVSQRDKEKDAFVVKKLFGRGLTGAKAREIVARECRENDKSAFLEKSGSHYISPHLPVVSTTRGGGFNLLPRLESFKVTLAGKVKKWSGYTTCSDRRCFVFCDDLFRYIEHLDPIKAVFSEVYSPDAFDVLYLFGTFRELVDPGCYAVIELKASTRIGLMEISDRIFQVKTQRLYDLRNDLWKEPLATV